MHRESQLLVLAVLYKVATNTELVNAELLLLEDILSQVPTSFLSQHLHQWVSPSPCLTCVFNLLALNSGSGTVLVPEPGLSHTLSS
jgi:hypothetical protein